MKDFTEKYRKINRRTPEEKKERFNITYWYGPPCNQSAKAVYRQVRDAGFTIAGPQGEGEMTPENNLKYLDACLANGLKATVQDFRIFRAVNDKDADWKKIIADIVEAYKDHPALFAYYVVDEPNESLFPHLAEIVAEFKKLDPAHPAYINLFPNYATPEQLGSPDYYTHVKHYLDTVKPAFLSYDHYHFLHMPDPSKQQEVELTGNEREDLIRKSAMINVDRGGFFDNLEDVRNLCLERNVPFMVIVLLIEHGPYRYLTEAEFRFEAFQSITYGASYLSYFTYWTVNDPDSWWGWKNAMIDVNGTVLDHYYDVQNVNTDLRQYGSELLGRKSLRVTHFGAESEKVTHYTPDDLVYAVHSEGRLTIGEFEGGYVSVANKDITNETTVRIKLSGKISVLRPDFEAWEDTGIDEIILVLKAGDMALLKIS